MSRAISGIGVVNVHRPRSTPSSTARATGSLTTLSSGTRIFAFTLATAPVSRFFAAIAQRPGAFLARASNRASSAESGWTGRWSTAAGATTGGGWTAPRDEGRERWRDKQFTTVTMLIAARIPASLMTRLGSGHAGPG